MDNIIIPYTDVEESSDESLGDSDENDEHSHLLSNNIGIHYNKFVKDGNFINMEDHHTYESIRNKYFTPEITKIRLMIESKNIAYVSGQERNTSNYTVRFENNQINSSSGYGNFNNVIGFRLIKANIFNSLYTVNENNKNLKIGTTLVTLEVGSYTFNELGNHLQTRLNAVLYPSVFTVVSNTVTYKYEITISSGTFTLNWDDVDGYFCFQSTEKGQFFAADIHLKAPFDPSKLKIYTTDFEGWELVTGVDYDGEELEGFDGYDTTGKGYYASINLT